MTDVISMEDLVANYADKVNDLELTVNNLKRMIERIGQEKRTCVADRSRFPMVNFLIIFTMWICNFAAILYLILR